MSDQFVLREICCSRDMGLVKERGGEPRIFTGQEAHETRDRWRKEVDAVTDRGHETLWIIEALTPETEASE
jgi:hypothetical protein